ncbi:sulfite exporter TauE/SafE family protein [Faecalicatena orotica]|uniref:sulfite exporter TauE/SafE family protein n=1 Tax=Faecalicatena orotica TaxID=1544 RepID=UPI0032171273
MLHEIMFQIILFLSNTIQTITGFAGTLLAMPFSIGLVGVEEAKAVLNLFTLATCLVITLQNRHQIQYGILLRIVCGMAAGMLAGIWLFDRLPLQMLLKLYAVLVILLALKKLLFKKEIPLPSWMMLFVVFASGIIHGMFLSGGALLVVYAVTVLKDKQEFRATMAPVWVILNALLMPAHYQAGYYTVHNLSAAAVSILPLVLSIALGNYLYRKISQKHFLTITYILLIISGASLLL